MSSLPIPLLLLVLVPQATPWQASSTGPTRSATPRSAVYAIQDLGLAAHFAPLVGDGFVAIFRHEPGEGADLNGDGDAVDRAVLSIYDPATETRIDTGLEVEPDLGSLALSRTLAAGDRLLAFTVDESAHGDANGDGDEDDAVAFYHDAASGTTTALGAIGPTNEFWAILGYRVSGRRILYAVNEASEGDVNDDGDSDDWILRLLDVDAGTTTTLAEQCWSFPFLLTEDFAIYRRHEEFCGLDLNGDLDATDHFVHLYDPDTGVTTDYPTGSTMLVDLPGTSGSKLFFAELEDGTDLNGDNDLTDWVLQVIDLSTLGQASTGLAVAEGGGQPWPWLTLAADLHQITDGDRFAFTVSEDAQQEDLNGDGDQLDDVGFLYDAEFVQPLHNLQLASEFERAVLLDDGVAIAVPEAAEGADLDGDGSLGQTVLHFASPADGQIWNTGRPLNTTTVPWPYSFTPVLPHGRFLGVRGPGLDPDFCLADPRDRTTSPVQPSEYWLGRCGVLSLTARRVSTFVFRLYVTDPRTGNTVDTHVPTGGTTEYFLADERRVVGITLTEQGWDGGPRDLNGDGDMDDTVAALLRQER